MASTLCSNVNDGESGEISGSPLTLSHRRLVSIDALRGAIMLIMLLDHVRETVFLHQQVGDPVAADTTSPALFFTRFLSSFCAPAFVLLAGTGAWLYGQKHKRPEVSYFLLTRGFFLIFLELVVIGFAWTGVFPPERFYLQVIWCIGLSMIALAGLIHVPKWAQYGVALFFVAGHHLLKGVHTTAEDWWHPIWAVLYQRDWIELFGIPARTSYPVLPWIGVIMFGYLIGPLFRAGYKFELRLRNLALIGVSLLAAFFLLRILNFYGDEPWKNFPDSAQTVMSFLALTKYPPSFLFILFTLAGAFFSLWFYEVKASSRWVIRLAEFGSAPLFFYILHLYVLKIIYLLLVAVFGKNQGDYYGVDYVWGIWLWSLVLAPFLFLTTCRFARFKKQRRDLKWLKYF